MAIILSSGLPLPAERKTNFLLVCFYLLLLLLIPNLLLHHYLLPSFNYLLLPLLLSMHNILKHTSVVMLVSQKIQPYTLLSETW